MAVVTSEALAWLRLTAAESRSLAPLPRPAAARLSCRPLLARVKPTRDADREGRPDAIRHTFRPRGGRAPARRPPPGPRRWASLAVRAARRPLAVTGGGFLPP